MDRRAVPRRAADRSSQSIGVNRRSATRRQRGPGGAVLARGIRLGPDLAARVMSLARPCQVPMTRPAFDDARPYVRAVMRLGAGDGF